MKNNNTGNGTDARCDYGKSFFPTSDFPLLIPLEKQWREIKKELDALNAPILEIHRHQKSFEDVVQEVYSHLRNGGEYGWLLGWNLQGPNSDWLQYGLVTHGSPVPGVSTKCPKTSALLDSIPGIKVAAFLTLKANTFIPGHTHPEIGNEGLLQYHLTLNVAKNRDYSYLNVNGEFRKNESGKSLVFDGSNYHFAINASQEDRTILYLEFYRDRILTK